MIHVNLMKHKTIIDLIHMVIKEHMGRWIASWVVNELDHLDHQGGRMAKRKSPLIDGRHKRFFKSDCCGGKLKWGLCDELASYVWRCKVCRQMCLPISKGQPL